MIFRFPQSLFDVRPAKLDPLTFPQLEPEDRDTTAMLRTRQACSVTAQFAFLGLTATLETSVSPLVPGDVAFPTIIRCYEDMCIGLDVKTRSLVAGHVQFGLLYIKVFFSPLPMGRSQL
jgi:hypothetical protein